MEEKHSRDFKKEKRERERIVASRQKVSARFLLGGGDAEERKIHSATCECYSLFFLWKSVHPFLH
jgi:hypothetical protein